MSGSQTDDTQTYPDIEIDHTWDGFDFQPPWVQTGSIDFRCTAGLIRAISWQNTETGEVRTQNVVLNEDPSAES